MAAHPWSPRSPSSTAPSYEVALQLGWVAGAAAGSLFSLSLPAGGFVLAALALAGLAGGKMAQARGKPEPQPH